MSPFYKWGNWGSRLFCALPNYIAGKLRSPGLDRIWESPPEPVLLSFLRLCHPVASKWLREDFMEEMFKLRLEGWMRFFPGRQEEKKSHRKEEQSLGGTELEIEIAEPGEASRDSSWRVLTNPELWLPHRSGGAVGVLNGGVTRQDLLVRKILLATGTEGENLKGGRSTGVGAYYRCSGIN